MAAKNRLEDAAAEQILTQKLRRERDEGGGGRRGLTGWWKRQDQAEIWKTVELRQYSAHVDDPALYILGGASGRVPAMSMNRLV